MAAIGQGVGRFKSIRRHGRVPRVGHDGPADPSRPHESGANAWQPSSRHSVSVVSVKSPVPSEITDKRRVTIGDVMSSVISGPIGQWWR